MSIVNFISKQTILRSVVKFAQQVYPFQMTSFSLSLGEFTQCLLIILILITSKLKLRSYKYQIICPLYRETFLQHNFFVFKYKNFQLIILNQTNELIGLSSFKARGAGLQKKTTKRHKVDQSLGSNELQNPIIRLMTNLKKKTKNRMLMQLKLISIPIELFIKFQNVDSIVEGEKN